MPDTRSQNSAPRGSGRERAVRAAYELFCREGTRAVGVDTVIARAGIAKMTLYRNFASKEALVLAFLERRAELWTRDWLGEGARRRAVKPDARLLAVFDLLDEWFSAPDFEGCAFVRTMLENTDPGSEVHRATVRHLAEVRTIFAELAEEAGVRDPEAVAHQWHLLVKGAIVSALEGDLLAARRAKELGVLLLRSVC